MTINIPGVDTKKGMALYGDEEDIYFIALQSYVNNTPAVVDKIRDVSQETLNSYSINVHGIKGTSANIGAEKIQSAAAELEAMSKAGDLDGVLAKNENFIMDIENTIKGIETWLERNQTES